MAQPEQVRAIAANSFLIEFDSGGMVSPRIHKVTGLSRKTGTVDLVDGGTNRKLSFSDGITEYGDVTFIRARDGSADDAAFTAFFDAVSTTGEKKSGQLIQFHFGVEVLRITFKGLLCHEQSFNDFATESSDKSEITVQAKVDFWEPSYTAL
jgi:hypothetical protein